ncbi:response regulator [Streptomyces sp. OE57]|uniref:response regulator n=1 Tax=Streptomyces lacaronensis TaxID=3379885 RepID=UPI0039B77906
MTTPDRATISVVVVDDHPLVRLGLRSFFEPVDGIEVVGEAGSGAETEGVLDELVRRGQPPDVVLMDILMPEGDGIATTAVLRRRHPGVAVVALTSFEDADYVRSALRAGAVGYVLKDGSPDSVLSTVRSAARGEQHIDVSLALKLAEPPPVDSSRLTAREQEVLALVGEGKSNQQIATALFITERTARTHVSNVLRKLGLSSRTQAALWAARDGRQLPRRP